MTLAEALLSVLLTRPVFKEDAKPELVEAKAAQLEGIATAIVEANKPPKWVNELDWLALVTAIGEEETHWSLRIGRNECKPWECDPRWQRGVIVEHRAVGYWQTQRNNHNAAVWAQLPSSTRLQADNANAMLRRGLWRCQRSGVPWLQATINGYAGVRCDADWPGLGKRIATWKLIRKKLAR